MKKILFALFLGGIVSFIVADSFVKPQKKSIPRVTAEDCVEDSLEETALFSSLLQSLGQSLEHMGKIMSHKVQYAQETVEDTKKGILKQASKEQLHHYRTKQAIFDQRIDAIKNALSHIVQQLNTVTAEHAQYLTDFEKAVAQPSKKK